MENEKTPEVSEKRRNLIYSYKRFSYNALSEQLNSENNTDDDIIKLTQFLRDNKDLIEIPLYTTCREFYDLGCKTMQTSYLIDFVVSAIFGVCLGLIFNPLLNYSEYWIISLIIAMISLIIIVVYLAVKKYKSKI